jgi:hypothetical protein
MMERGRRLWWEKGDEMTAVIPYLRTNLKGSNYQKIVNFRIPKGICHPTQYLKGIEMVEQMTSV